MVAEHKIGTRAEWLSARLELLQREKELTRFVTSSHSNGGSCRGCRSTSRTASRPRPGRERWRSSSTDARSCSSTTSCSAPEWTEGCPSCSFWADTFDGAIVHLKHRDVTMLCVSRAPLAYEGEPVAVTAS